jgi:transcriptional regulator with XRE-family HTH domain
MQIKQVMQRYGYTPSSLAKKMGVYVSTVSRLIDGNPTVEKLDELARWIGCQRWEFFADEMQAAGMQVVPNGTEPAQPSAEPAVVQQSADKMGAAHEVSTGGKQSPAISQQAIICPHCHSALVFKIEAYGESK